MSRGHAGPLEQENKLMFSVIQFITGNKPYQTRNCRNN
jgi:hypothetical protein